MAITIPGAAQVTVMGTMLGRPWANVFHVSKGGNALLDEPGADAIATEFGARWQAQLVPVLSNDWFMTEVRVLDLQTATSPSFGFSISEQGALTQDALSPDSSGIVTWRTALRGTANRGRTYLAGGCEGDNEDTGRPGAGFVTAMQTWADLLIGNLLAAGTPMVVGHREAHTFTEIVTAEARNVWRRQRRRNFRV